MKAIRWLPAFLIAVVPCLAQPDILVSDFEGDTYGSWTASGLAFGDKPARGALTNQMPVSGFLGRGLANSYYGGDKSTGTLTSAEFVIERPHLAFLIGGGAHANKTCVNLLIDSKVVRTTAGNESEQLEWAGWDVSEFNGKKAHIQIMDMHTEGWGHVNVDHIVQSAQPKAELIATNELYNETWRPQFHFTAQKNWLNDPNGLVFYEGEYHLFFQYNPEGNVWGNMTWGHAISEDLIHWKQRANALERDKLGTMFSGSAVVDWRDTARWQDGSEKTLVAIYTAAGNTSPESKGAKFTQCVAYSNDRGRSWQKYDHNPVLKHIAGENRDPKVVWHAPSRKWIMALYLEGDRFGFYSSPDLKNWTPLHEMNVPGCDECPDFFEMPVEGRRGEKRWVWTAANGNYLIGRFDGQKFSPESGPHRADWGKHFYAVQTYSDIPRDDGRRIQIAWMRGGKYPGMPFNQQMSFPCELRLRAGVEGLRVHRLPVREISLLQTNEHQWADKVIAPGENVLSGISGELFDIRADIELRQASRVRFKVRGESVEYSLPDRRLACLGQTAPLDPVADRIKLQILVDRTSIEVFANDGRVSMSTCFLPASTNKTLEFTVSGGPSRLRSLRVSELKSAWSQ